MPVYFIRAADSGHVKIGRANDPAHRIRELQTSHWDELNVVREIAGGRQEERWLHRHYREQHIAREWFRWSDDMLTVVVPPPPRIVRSIKIERGDWRALDRGLEFLTQESFVEMIERFLVEHDVTATRFGINTLHDPNFVFDIRAGRSMSLKNISRVIAYMRSFQTLHGAAA